MVQDEDQQIFSELKGAGKLTHDLIDAVHELEKNRGTICVLVFVVSVSDSLQKGLNQSAVIKQNLRKVIERVSLNSCAIWLNINKKIPPHPLKRFSVLVSIL